MPRLEISVLGPFRASVDGRPVTGFESNKVRALLAYLAAEPGRPHARAALADLLWPDRPDRDALACLRCALLNLRQALNDGATQPPFLSVTRQDLAFNLKSDHWLDVAQFDALVRCGEPPALMVATTLCRGEFLEGLSVAGGEAWDEWVALRCGQLGRRMFRALSSLADAFERCGEYELARYYAQRQVEREPWQEEAHRQLMRALALGGHRSAALVQFEACRRGLAVGLDVEPAKETLELYEAIRDGVLEPALRPVAARDDGMRLPELSPRSEAADPSC